MPGGHHEVAETLTSSFDQHASDVESIVRDLSIDIALSATGRESLLVDLAFDFDGDPRIELMIGLALASATQLSGLGSIVVLFEDLPTARQELRRRFESDEQLQAKTVLCSVNSTDFVAPTTVTWDVVRFVEHVHYTPADLRQIAESKVVRRRGVFESPFDSKHFGYWYSAENAAHELRRLFERYLDDNQIDKVVYDANAEHWLVAVLEEICNEQSEYVLFSSNDLSGLDALSEVEGRRVAIIGPMLRTGTTFREIDQSLGRSVSHASWLAVMANRNDSDVGSTYFRTKSFAMTADAAPVPVDYFVPVTHDVIPVDDWRLSMAHAASPTEIEDPLSPWISPTTTAMWSLIQSLPAGPENPSPAGRQPIAFFPQLNALDEEDATWLAESFLRIAEDIGAKRSLLVVILPQEEPAGDGPRNGSRPLTDAFKQRLRVVTTTVRRSDIDASNAPPAELRELLERHPGYDVAIIDESAVSFQSLLGISSMVTKANNGNPPRLLATVVEAVTGRYRTPADYRSLFQWQPI